VEGWYYKKFGEEIIVSFLRKRERERERDVGSRGVDKSEKSLGKLRDNLLWGREK
jgi:hypothetical protein